MFRMAALNCGLLLLVTVVITGTGNVIYQNSIEESSYANTMDTVIGKSDFYFHIADPDQIWISYFIQKNISPVSYTHLDVYKRQTQAMSSSDR